MHSDPCYQPFLEYLARPGNCLRKSSAGGEFQPAHAAGSPQTRAPNSDSPPSRLLPAARLPNTTPVTPPLSRRKEMETDLLPTSITLHASQPVSPFSLFRIRICFGFRYSGFRISSHASRFTPPPLCDLCPL